jgi:membrane-bound metal-dependent hydrolase YbcI (DUF457 family)
LPFTPFHFGPGLFAKSLASRHFSWMAFVASQIVIDVEPLYYMVRRTYPAHRFFHTFVGATLAAVLTLVMLFAVRHILQSYAVSGVGRESALWPSLRSELSNTGLMMGALVGGISHPLLDGIMHRDIRPFAPWTERNPLLAFVDLPTLHVGCLLLGTMGFTLMAVRLYRERQTGSH